MKFFTYKNVYALFFLLALCVLGVRGYGQTPPTKLWDKTYGTAQAESPVYSDQLSDGGYIIAASTISGINGDKTVTNADASNSTFDIWVIKVDANGNKLWDKSFGTTTTEFCYGIAEVVGGNGDFYLFCYTSGGISGAKSVASKGGVDFWVLRVNSSGVKVWDKGYGGLLNENLSAGIATSDGGFLLTGQSLSQISGDKSETVNTGGSDSDIWVLKCDGTGTKQWDRAFGTVGIAVEAGRTAFEATDAYLVGCTVSGGATGSVTEPSRGPGSDDAWIVKLNKTNGALIWQKRIGTANVSDKPVAIVPTNDGGYLVTIIPLTASGTPSGGDMTDPSNGFVDYWVVKLSATGTKIWDQNYGGSNMDYTAGMLKVSDGYIIHGNSFSDISGDKTSPMIYNGASGSMDGWLFKIDESGNKVWDKVFGSMASEGSNSFPPKTNLFQPSTGGFVFILETFAPPSIANDHDRTTPSKGFNDIWIVRTAPPMEADLAVTVSPATATGNQGESLSYTVTITNNGPMTVPNATVKVPIPNGRTFLSAVPSAGSYSFGTKVWTVGSLANGASATMVISIKVN